MCTLQYCKVGIIKNSINELAGFVYFPFLRTQHALVLIVCFPVLRAVLTISFLNWSQNGRIRRTGRGAFRTNGI